MYCFVRENWSQISFDPILRFPHCYFQSFCFVTIEFQADRKNTLANQFFNAVQLQMQPWHPGDAVQPNVSLPSSVCLLEIKNVMRHIYGLNWHQDKPGAVCLLLLWRILHDKSLNAASTAVTQQVHGRWVRDHHLLLFHTVGPEKMKGRDRWRDGWRGGGMGGEARDRNRWQKAPDHLTSDLNSKSDAVEWTLETFTSNVTTLCPHAPLSQFSCTGFGFLTDVCCSLWRANYKWGGLKGTQTEHDVLWCLISNVASFTENKT